MPMLWISGPGCYCSQTPWHWSGQRLGAGRSLFFITTVKHQPTSPREPTCPTVSLRHLIIAARPDCSFQRACFACLHKVSFLNLFNALHVLFPRDCSPEVCRCGPAPGTMGVACIWLSRSLVHVNHYRQMQKQYAACQVGPRPGLPTLTDHVVYVGLSPASHTWALAHLPPEIACLRCVCFSPISFSQPTHHPELGIRKLAGVRVIHVIR